MNSCMQLFDCTSINFLPLSKIELKELIVYGPDDFIIVQANYTAFQFDDLDNALNYSFIVSHNITSSQSQV